MSDIHSRYKLLCSGAKIQKIQNNFVLPKFEKFEISFLKYHHHHHTSLSQHLTIMSDSLMP
jgi:hypothetical protein